MLTKGENRVENRGRKPGVPNRTTKQSREAIALFVNQNLPRLDLWLNQIANGIPKVDADGVPLRDNQGSIAFVVKPDPYSAFKALSDICEYHLPKLSRQDVSVTAITGTLDNLSPFARELLLMTPERVAAHLEATHEAQRVPAWLRADTIDVTPAKGAGDE